VWTGKFFAEHLIWTYKKYRRVKKRLHYYITDVKENRKKRRQMHGDGEKPGECGLRAGVGHVGCVSVENGKTTAKGPADEHDCATCAHCREHEIDTELIGIENRIPASLVLAILVLYTALGGVLMSELEGWTFMASFYYSFITMTTVCVPSSAEHTLQCRSALAISYLNVDRIYSSFFCTYLSVSPSQLCVSI
jgi:hypothetical protein